MPPRTLESEERSHPAVVKRAIRVMVETSRATSKAARAGADASAARARIEAGARASSTSSVPGTHSSFRRTAVLFLAIASGVGAAFAHTNSTGARVSDVLVAFVVGAGASLAASRAKPWAWAVASVLAVAGGGWPWALLACAAVAVCAVDSWVVTLPHRRVVGAAIGAVDVQVLLRMPTGRLALNTLVAVVAVGCLLYSGRDAFAPYIRGRRRTIVIVVAVVVAVPAFAIIASALRARHSVAVGIARSQEGLHAARSGDGEGAARLFDEARAAFHDAHGDLGGWWTKPALLLPGVGQQAHALDLLSGAGADLAQAASIATRSARIESLRVHDGRLDLNRVRSLSEPLASVQRALDSAARTSSRVDSPWLVPPIAHDLDMFMTEVGNAQTDTETGAQAVAVLPDLLGGSGRRQYFVIFGTPSEARDLGGFMGAYGVLTANNGKLELGTTGRVRDLNNAGRRRKLTDPSVFPDRFRSLQPQKFWQDITGTSDFPTVSEAVRQMWSQSGGKGPLDGVLYMDPVTLAALMKLTGPVTVPGYDTPLTADTAVDFLLRGQYVAFPNDDRHEFQVDAAKTVFKKLTTGQLPKPSVMGDTLAPAVAERRLLVHSFHPEEQALFARLNVDGALPPVDIDFLSVRSSNLGLSKIDSFMHRTVTDDVVVDPWRNQVQATVTVTVRNDAPASGLPPEVIGNHRGQPDGTNSTTVAVSTPLQVVDVTVGGVSVARAANTEYGRFVYTALVDVPAGGQVTVEFRLQGSIDLRRGYRLTLLPQPLVNADEVDVHVKATTDARHDIASRTGELHNEETVSAP
jgi:hypothetical protein